MVPAWALLVLATALLWWIGRMVKKQKRNTMANTLVIYTDPIGARVEVHADNGAIAVGVPQASYQGRDDAQLVTIPFDSGGTGAQINISADGYTPFEGRAILTAGGGAAALQIDDFHLALAPSPVPPPDTGGGGGGEMPADPLGIINWTYANGHFDLSTKEGCGKFTEACCTNLHDQHSQMWGHIRKNPGQNQYNGHAVDAIQLAAGAGTGIYDIIYSSESHEAYPTYNYKGPADLSLWYYPAEGQKL